MNNKTRHIGQDKTRLASVGIGAMSFSNFYGPCNDEQADSILTAAIDLGLNHIDTSNVYGICLLYTSPSPRDLSTSRMPSSA